ncbi:MAG: hypothetical protein WCP79_03945, partial [Bacillota bacterium]
RIPAQRDERWCGFCFLKQIMILAAALIVWLFFIACPLELMDVMQTAFQVAGGNPQADRRSLRSPARSHSPATFCLYDAW